MAKFEFENSSLLPCHSLQNYSLQQLKSSLFSTVWTFSLSSQLETSTLSPYYLKHSQFSKLILAHYQRCYSHPTIESQSPSFLNYGQRYDPSISADVFPLSQVQKISPFPKKVSLLSDSVCLFDHCCPLRFNHFHPRRKAHYSLWFGSRCVIQALSPDTKARITH